MSFKTINYAVAVFLSVHVTSVSAQDTFNSTKEQVQSLSLYGLNLSEITPEIEESVANWANPLILTIPEGQSPREAALAACPSVGEIYFEVFRKRGKEWNPHLADNFDIDVNMAGSHIALAPNCIQNHTQQVTVARGQLVEREFLRAYISGLGDPATAAEIAGRDFSESVAALNDRDVTSLNQIGEGEQLLLPLPRADFITSPEGAAAISNAVRGNFAEWTIGINTPIENFGGEMTKLHGKSHVALENICVAQSDGTLLTRHTTKFSEVYEAIFWSISEARRIGREPPAKSSIAILDTGLPHSDRWKKSDFVEPISDLVADKMFLPEEFNSQYYESFSKMWSEVAPSAFLEVEQRSSHTESVLGAAMGGYYGYLFNASFGVIEPSVFSIFVTDTVYSSPPRPIFVPESSAIKSGIEAIGKVEKNYVVNISAGTPNDTHGDIRDALAAASSKRKDLIIVSAGNNGENAGLDRSEIYPANYGGRNAEAMPLITVGGHTNPPDTDVWEGSNRGEHVDILALGCDVQTVKFVEDGSNDRIALNHEKGTSLSAPRVTFAAAVIMHLLSHRNDLSTLENVPMIVKNRILSSSDLNPELRDDVVDGRTLNIAKAVSLFSDLVERTPGSIERGSIEFATGTSDFNICKDKHRVAPDEVRKIAKWEADDGDKYKIYFVRPGQERLLTCTDFQAPRMVFKSVSIANGETVETSLDDFEDIVFSIPDF